MPSRIFCERWCTQAWGPGWVPRIKPRSTTPGNVGQSSRGAGGAGARFDACTKTFKVAQTCTNLKTPVTFSRQKKGASVRRLDRASDRKSSPHAKKAPSSCSRRRAPRWRPRHRPRPRYSRCSRSARSTSTSWRAHVQGSGRFSEPDVPASTSAPGAAAPAEEPALGLLVAAKSRARSGPAARLRL